MTTSPPGPLHLFCAALLVMLGSVSCQSPAPAPEAPRPLCVADRQCETLCVGRRYFEPGGTSVDTSGECAPVCLTNDDCRAGEACSAALSYSATRVCVPECATGLLSTLHACDGREQTHLTNTSGFRCTDHCAVVFQRDIRCDSLCPEGQFCEDLPDGECVPIGQLGAPCTWPTECESQNCRYSTGTCGRAHGDACDGTDCSLCVRQAGGDTFCHADAWTACGDCDSDCYTGGSPDRWGHCVERREYDECPDFEVPGACMGLCPVGYHLDSTHPEWGNSYLSCIPDAENIISAP